MALGDKTGVEYSGCNVNEQDYNGFVKYLKKHLYGANPISRPQNMQRNERPQGMQRDVFGFPDLCPWVDWTAEEDGWPLIVMCRN